MKRKPCSEKSFCLKGLFAVLLFIAVFAFTGCNSQPSGENPVEAGKVKSNTDSQNSVLSGTSESDADVSGEKTAGTEGKTLAAADNSDKASSTAGNASGASGSTGDDKGETGVSAESGDNAGLSQGGESERVDESDTDSSEDEDDKKTDADGSGITLSAEDDSDWTNSFLLFLPRFTDGVEEDRICEETFDHIIIGGIDSKRKIEDYVEEVKAAGFNVDADYVDHNGEIDFHAYNKDGWYVVIDYDIGVSKVDIGCGFFKEEKEKGPESYFDEEILQAVPMPEAGTLTGGKADGDYPYALYEGCSLEDAKAYAKALRNAGFDEEVQEGEGGDIYWYNAVGQDGIVCDMQYADGIIMIGCDKSEE